MKSKDLSKFHFQFAGIGCYDVTYTTGRGDYHEALVDYMPIIDSTKNAESVKVKDVKALRNLVKRIGKHYHKNGLPF